MSRRIRRLWGALVGTMSVAQLAGCAGCGPIQANWYLLEGATDGDPQRVHLALINTGQEVVNVHGVFRGSSSQVAHWASGPFVALEPGILRVISADQGVGGCAIPVSVELSCPSAPRRQDLQVTGTLPNVLTASWVRDCTK